VSEKKRKHPTRNNARSLQCRNQQGSSSSPFRDAGTFAAGGEAPIFLASPPRQSTGPGEPPFSRRAWIGRCITPVPGFLGALSAARGNHAFCWIRSKRIQRPGCPGGTPISNPRLPAPTFVPYTPHSPVRSLGAPAEPGLGGGDPRENREKRNKTLLRHPHAVPSKAREPKVWFDNSEDTPRGEPPE